MGEMDRWVVTIEGELEQIDNIRIAKEQQLKRRSIRRIPASMITDLNKKAYEPQFVSFGPYHNGKDHLMPMEKHKHHAFLHFLKRSRNSLTSYINSLTKVAQCLKDFYESLVLVWEGDIDRFLQMMIVDGCFMIELLRYFGERRNDYDYAEDDPIFSIHGMFHIVPHIKRDMLMLENQLPMLLLTTLLDEETEEDEDYVDKLIGVFCFGKTCFRYVHSLGKCLNVLDAYREILVCQDTRSRRSSQNSWPWNLCRGMCLLASDMGDEDIQGSMIIRSAMEIYEAGIRFKKSKTQSLAEISFQGGVLWLPPILVDDTTESLFLNLMAFERFHAGVGNEVSAYIFFMYSIIRSAEDVRLLHNEGIILNVIGDDKAVVELFHSFTKDLTISPSRLLEVLESVERYCKQPWSKWRAVINHTTFAFLATKPWAIISVSAAFLLFTLTILQTIFTMLSYYHT